ncbi:MAG: hypothetical protein ACPIA8_02110 [Candidatus Puniceispirillaceae bacterium]
MPEILARHNRRVHACIYKAAGNHFLEEQLTRLAQMMVLSRVTAYSEKNSPRQYSGRI